MNPLEFDRCIFETSGPARRSWPLPHGRGSVWRPVSEPRPL